MSDFFNLTLSLGDNQAKLLDEGKIPLISSGTINNGICKFIKNGDGKSKIYDGNLITIDMFGQPFFHKYPFYSVSHGRVNILLNKKNMNEECKKFFLLSIQKSTKHIFSYNHMCSQKRLKNLKINLPINKKEEVNFKHMKEYMKALEMKNNCKF